MSAPIHRRGAETLSKRRAASRGATRGGSARETSAPCAAGIGSQESFQSEHGEKLG